ncbi:MAG: sigma-70 family RNA polymerase sigma factor [Prevotella sp.]|nr:sigma-70 family RNA polymerase sigma factor [Prevotella sp.]
MAASLSDISLVTQVAVFRNKRAFDQIVRKYQSPVRRFLLNLTLGDEMLSDDLAQDTFLKAYLNIGQFRGRASLQTWLMRIAYNVFYDYKRKEKGIVKSAEFAAAAQGTPAENAAAAANSSLFTFHSSLKTDIYRALSILKEEERTCITLQLIDGYALDEIAGITAMPLNTVKSHLRRGKERLATYLKQNG